MDISKFKFELYDILAVLLPGFVLLGDGWVLLRGWHAFTVALLALTGTGVTALLLIAFPLGHLVQELGDATIKGVCGPRYFKRGRDGIWKKAEGEKVRKLLCGELGFEPSTDTAFDFCLTKIAGSFAKRDAFVATSDFCRSIFILGFLLIPSIVRVIIDAHATRLPTIIYTVVAVIVWSAFMFLSHRRMCRFRELSETPVFTTYLASFGKAAVPAPSAPAHEPQRQES